MIKIHVHVLENEKKKKKKVPDSSNFYRRCELVRQAFVKTVIQVTHKAYMVTTFRLLR